MFAAMMQRQASSYQRGEPSGNRGGRTYYTPTYHTLIEAVRVRLWTSSCAQHAKNTDNNTNQQPIKIKPFGLIVVLGAWKKKMFS